MLVYDARRLKENPDGPEIKRDLDHDLAVSGSTMSGFFKDIRLAGLWKDTPFAPSDKALFNGPREDLLAAIQALLLAAKNYGLVEATVLGGQSDAPVVQAFLSGEALAKAMKEKIREKDGDLKGDMNSQGTTPRQLTDLLGSLCDLTSGSGDRGTPVILIQNYFTNYASE